MYYVSTFSIFDFFFYFFGYYTANISWTFLSPLWILYWSFLDSLWALLVLFGLFLAFFWPFFGLFLAPTPLKWLRNIWMVPNTPVDTEFTEAFMVLTVWGAFFCCWEEPALLLSTFEWSLASGLNKGSDFRSVTNNKKIE